jgi:hypothetical protein
VDALVAPAGILACQAQHQQPPDGSVWSAPGLGARDGTWPRGGGPARQAQRACNLSEPRSQAVLMAPGIRFSDHSQLSALSGAVASLPNAHSTRSIQVKRAIGRPPARLNPERVNGAGWMPILAGAAASQGDRVHLHNGSRFTGPPGEPPASSKSATITWCRIAVTANGAARAAYLKRPGIRKRARASPLLRSRELPQPLPYAQRSDICSDFLDISEAVGFQPADADFFPADWEFARHGPDGILLLVMGAWARAPDPW